MIFTKDGELQPPLEEKGVVPGWQSLQLWIANASAATTALSAYQFNFAGGDFATHRLNASSWSESGAFAGLDPPWLPVDQGLDTSNDDYVVDGVTGSLQTPFVGPALPLGVPILIGTFDVYVDAVPGEFVDVLLSATSGVDDQNGGLGGAGIDSFGVADVPVVPEPNSLSLLIGGVLSLHLAGRRRL